MITLDSTSYSTVVRCTECTWWYGFADSEDEGWRVGRAHAQRSGCGSDNARKNVTLRTRRAGR